MGTWWYRVIKSVDEFQYGRQRFWSDMSAWQKLGWYKTWYHRCGRRYQFLILCFKICLYKHLLCRVYADFHCKSPIFKKMHYLCNNNRHNVMRYNTRDIIEYIIALVNEFARRFDLSDKQAYHYIRIHKGVAFIEQNYGIIHTLDFNEAVESIALYCRRAGGKLWCFITAQIWLSSI